MKNTSNSTTLWPRYIAYLISYGMLKGVIEDLTFSSCEFNVVQEFSDEKPLAWSHFTAEGDVEFKAILFVPPKAPHNLYESYYNANKSNLKLYVRRVFISDEFDELLPKYLSFLKVFTCVLRYCSLLHFMRISIFRFLDVYILTLGAGTC